MIGTAGKPKAPGTASVVGGGGGRPQKDATAAPKKVVAGVDPVSRVKPTEIVSRKEVDTAVVRKPQFGKAAAERARQLMSAKTHVSSELRSRYITFITNAYFDAKTLVGGMPFQLSRR